MRCHRLLGLVVAATLIACAGARALPPKNSVDVAAADNAFGFRLLNELQNTSRNGNAILSPVSAALNLAMVLNGADGETRREMLSALSLNGLTAIAINAANADLIKVIRTPSDDVTLALADSLWVDSAHVSLRPEYIRQTQAGYDATISDVDFSSPSVASRINGWASKATQGRIVKIVDRIGPVERLLLIDAVYFKGQWTRKFDKSQTEPRDFTLADGTVKQAPRMLQAANLSYFETPQMQAVRLPFGRGELAMDVLLPTPASSLDALESDLAAGHWQDLQRRFASRAGTIGLPRFELKVNDLLNQSLQALGMKRAFRKDAELTGMFSQQKDAGGNFFISSVLQSIFWKVDEEGAEAAAVTSTHIHALALQQQTQAPFNMIVDRPFFCAIEDRRSGALLFIAAIYDPST